MHSNREIKSTTWFSIRENLTPDGLAKIFDFEAGRYRLVEPDEALALIVEHRASLETIPRKGPRPGGLSPAEIVGRIRKARGMAER